MSLLGKLYCLLTKSHKWSKPKEVEINELGELMWIKQCKRCPAVRPVKRRKKGE